MTHRLFGFIDGENLVHRYQDMVAEGRNPLPDVVHVKDAFVRHPGITQRYYADVVRISFYQTVVGDQQKLDAACDAIGSVRYEYSAEPDNDGAAYLRPRVFKKEKKSAKTKSVDINLTVDMLRHADDGQCTC